MNSKVIKQILWWEKQRLKFNLMMFITGFFFLIFIIEVKPLPKGMIDYYTTLVLAYSIFINIFFTFLYAFTMLLVQRCKLQDNTETIYNFTKRFLFVGGLIINILSGSLEIIYRITVY